MSFEALIGSTEAAAFFGIHPVTLLKWAREGKVPCYRLGRRVAFRKSDLNDWLGTVYTDSAVRAAQSERKAA